MSFDGAFFGRLHAHGTALHARVLGRDDAHLAPERFSVAAAGRLRAGIAALESWLRRVLILMALALEPSLAGSGRPWSKTVRSRRLAPRRRGLRIFAAGRPGAGVRLAALGRARILARRPIPAAPLLARLAALRELLDRPEARARRLAFHLARRRPGPVLAPAYRGPASGRLFGSETGALHDALAQAILEQSRARPPPLGPAPRAGPRIRAL